mmetsp:Transcript_9897/g.29745  ORF Transcript_9897/g.29745 Transcript_9897/m.29745 type:complete len:319 (-) Transcript_9897:193-1149(-)|eukprot:CAMPEP_0206148940 /NCGR_PEP_ID=MMETSP1473-20131121/37517_1 /ASSEMBLY_ACC=CAM_ASM_001109 /TAXON_ID=1461547 /ORGANISM="Stichococcus sp, Strain RCC1054" /LENGTH=318 /DNA_ID=CAMNT_0053546375 /DNA_START=667 /DNA_END=1623 /DNA_ORIENTATION=-
MSGRNSEDSKTVVQPGVIISTKSDSEANSGGPRSAKIQGPNSSGPDAAASVTNQMQALDLANAETLLSVMPKAALRSAAEGGRGLMVDGFMIPPSVLKALGNLSTARGGSKSGQSDGGRGSGKPPKALHSVQSGSPHPIIEPAAPKSCAAAAAEESSPDTATDSPLCSSDPSSGMDSTGAQGRSSGELSLDRGSTSSTSGTGADDSYSSCSSSGRHHFSGAKLLESSDPEVAELEASLAKLQDIAHVNSGLMRRLGAEFSTMTTKNDALQDRLTTLSSQLAAREAEVAVLKGELVNLSESAGEAPPSYPQYISVTVGV